MIKKIKIFKEGAKIPIDTSVYSKESIIAASYSFLDRAYIILEKNQNKIVVNILPKNKKEDIKKLSLDFYNELINYAHYIFKFKTNAKAFKELMEKALFSASYSVTEEEDKEIQELIKELEKEESLQGKKRK